MKKLLLLMIIAIAAQSQTNAAISVDQTTNPTILKNAGYSKDVTDTVNVLKARAHGKEYYTDDEQAYRNQNWLTKFWRKLYVYTDPAAEDYSIFHHDIDPVSKYTDL